MYMYGPGNFWEWLYFGCCQRIIAGKTLATSHRMGSWWWINWPRVHELFSNSVHKILPWRFRAIFLLRRVRTKSGWQEVDQELDMGCQLLAQTFLRWNCRGLSCSNPLVTPKSCKQWNWACVSSRTFSSWIYAKSATALTIGWRRVCFGNPCLSQGHRWIRVTSFSEAETPQKTRTFGVPFSCSGVYVCG